MRNTVVNHISLIWISRARHTTNGKRGWLYDVFRRSWEEREEQARDRKELWREREMKERWKIIMEKAIDFATIGPTTDFNFKRCRSQSC
jgi:hypothetical protein